VERHVGRPKIIEKVDVAFVTKLRESGLSWNEIMKAHGTVKSSSGREVKPSVGSIRRAFAMSQASGQRLKPT